MLLGVSPDLSHVCTRDSCLYTRDNDTSLYCFSSRSCVNKLSQLHRVSPKLLRMTPGHLMSGEEEQEYLRQREKTSGSRKTDSQTCCPVKTVISYHRSFVQKPYIDDDHDDVNDNIAAVFLVKMKQPQKVIDKY